MSYDCVIYLNMTGAYSNVKPTGKRIRLVTKFAEVVLFEKNHLISNMNRLFIRTAESLF